MKYGAQHVLGPLQVQLSRVCGAVSKKKLWPTGASMIVMIACITVIEQLALNIHSVLLSGICALSPCLLLTFSDVPISIMVVELIF